ncbi:MAG TPA: CPBP family intramembrane glutamic endopeptidase [Propionibacteriaceae bacterium]|nr:CPBP family intramembrane glutamic endopeptidase [Propionibacteriaceae bacterium]
MPAAIPYAAGWPVPPAVGGAKVKPTPLPVTPKRYHQFLQTPRRRWWKILVALPFAAVLWIFASVIAILPAMFYDVAHSGAHGSQEVIDYLAGYTQRTTPAFFIANNVSIAMMIPVAWLVLRVVYGQTPRWLSSVAGRFRWGWMFRLMGLILVVYVVVQAIDYAFFSGVPALSWKPYSLFLIVGILITTPLQCAGEELGVRGFTARVLGSYGSAKVSFWIASVLSSVLFMFLHAAQDPYLNAFYFTFGMAASWMAWRTGGLEASIAMHVVNNVVSEVTMPFTDISGTFDRQTGAASAWDIIPLAVLMVTTVALIEWQVRRRKPLAVAAPGAAGDGPIVTGPAALPAT